MSQKLQSRLSEVQQNKLCQLRLEVESLWSKVQNTRKLELNPQAETEIERSRTSPSQLRSV